MRRINWVLLIILLIGACLRLVRLDYLELFGDELDAGYQAYSLMTTGRDYKGNLLPSYAQSFSEWRAPLMMYFMTPFIKIFGLNEWGVRTYSAFFGLISILGFYFFLKVLGVKNKIALLSIFLVAITPWHIQYSRAGFELTLLASLILWGCYFFIIYLNKKSWISVSLSAFLLSLSFYTYNTANIYVPLIIGVIFISGYLSKKSIIIRPYFVLLLLMFFLSLPILLQIFRGHGADRFQKFSVWGNEVSISSINNYRNLSQNSWASKIFFNKPVETLKSVLFNYTNTFSSDFLFGMGDVTFRHSLHKVGNLFWTDLILISTGLIILITKKNKMFLDYIMIGFLIVSPIPSSLTIDGAYHASRLFLMIFPLAYFGAEGIAYIYKKYRLLSFLLAAALLFEFSYYQFYYWNFYKLESWRWWHYGYKEIMLDLKIEEPNYKKVLIDNTYEPSLIRYLFWNHVNSKTILDIQDQMNKDVEGYKGFCINEKVCFVDFNGKIGTNLSPSTIYLINQEKHIGGDWDWKKNPPESIKVLNQVKSPDGNPLFYLVTGRTK